MVGGCVCLPERFGLAHSQGSRSDLSGSCPANAPSTCIGGPKWSTNGMFLLVPIPQHLRAVLKFNRSLVFHAPRGKGEKLDEFIVLTCLPSQMVDKIWYDWQNINSANFWAYRGGATAVNEDPSVTNATYPNGSPPMLTVRGPLTSTRLTHEFFSSSRIRSQRITSYRTSRSMS